MSIIGKNSKYILFEKHANAPKINKYLERYYTICSKNGRKNSE